MNSEIFKDPASILSICRDRFNQIKDLVDNTDSSRINVDLPRYIHRLRHPATRLRHLFLFAKLGAEMQSSVLMLREELQRFVQEIAGELRAAERIQPAPTHTVGMAHPP
jgi:CHAD domain-containing protein